MRAFNNGKPQLSSSDRTRDIASRNVYADTKSKKSNDTNYDGSIIYDTTNNHIKSYESYELYRAVNYGYNFCDDCSGVCPTNPGDPEIQTENNQFSVMKFSNVTDIVINASGDKLLANGGNLDGSGVFIDPSGILFGSIPCNTKAYLSFMKDLSGVDISGNDTNQNYLRCYSFPNKVKF